MLLTACEQAVSKPVWHIPLLCVQWKTPDDGQRNCPKHAEFYSKNKSEKFVHLVGFITRIYHDTRSTERQICAFFLIQIVILPNWFLYRWFEFHSEDVISIFFFKISNSFTQCIKPTYTFKVNSQMDETPTRQGWTGRCINVHQLCQ